MKIKNKSVFECILMGIIYLFLILFAVCCLYPFLEVFAKSISGEADIMAGNVHVIPKNVHLNAYKYVFNQKSLLVSFKNTVIVTLLGTAIGLFLTTMSAYALARKRFREQRVIIVLYIFTMIFSAGLIPGYLLVRSLGLYDTIWALILPTVVSPYNLIITRTFFQSISESLEEAATMEGAGHFRIYFNVVMPMSKPVLASIGLFYAVDFWNDFFRSMIYITSQENYTLQLYLRSILINTTDISNTLDPTIYGNVAAESVQNATIIVSFIPILLVYPFLQKYFAAGVNVGAVKE